MNDKENSRKWKLTKWAFWAMTAMLIIPGLVSLVLALIGMGITFTLMTPDLYITGLGLLVGLYGAANVIQKKLVGPSIPMEDLGDGSGGQPEGTDNP